MRLEKAVPVDEHERLSSSACSSTGWPERHGGHLIGRPDGLPGRDLHRRGAGAPRAPLHEPRPARVRAREPARDGEGRAVRALLALPGHAAAALPRRVRRRLAEAARAAFDGEEGERAPPLYERIFLGYGDDSVAQLGGAHIACEWVSNVMTKLLQRGRLAAYLEQSTRYIPYDAPMARARLPLLARPRARARVRGRDGLPLRRLRASRCRACEAWAAERFPRATDEPEAAHRRSIQAKALDLLRGLLPGGLALAHGHLRHGPGLRAAAAAPVRLAAARGARLRPA